MNLLAAEISTASAKALIYSPGEGVKIVKSVPFDKSICDIATQDPEGVFAALAECIRHVVRETGPVEAMGICTTWHSLLMLDGSRKPLGRIYTWANSTASSSVKNYRKDQKLCNWIYGRTGCMVNSTYPLWQYIHLRDTQPDLCRKAVFLSSQQEYAFELLTGEIAASRCTASGSGFLNTHTLDWDDEVFAFAGIRRDMFAPLKEPAYAAPLESGIAAELGLTPGIPVIIGGADGALNQIGDGALKEGVMTLSVGTSGAIRLVSDRAILPESPSTFCYYLTDGLHIIGGSTAGAGNCLEWLVNRLTLGPRLSYRELDEAVKMVDAADAPFFLPFLYGERCPGWLDDRMGAFLNLNSRHGIADMYYSVLEGVLFNLYHCYTLLTGLMSPPSRILASGGIAHSGYWMQMVADIFKKDISITDTEHVSLLGAAALIMKSLGLTDSLGQERLDKVSSIAFDNVSSGLYEKRFEKYKEFYSMIKD